MTGLWRGLWSALTLKYGYDISTMQMQSKSITLKMKIITIEMSFKIGSELVSSAWESHIKRFSIIDLVSPVFSAKAEKYGREKLRIRTL